MPANTNQTIEDFYALATMKDFARLHQLRIIDWLDKGYSVMSPEKITSYILKQLLYLIEKL